MPIPVASAGVFAIKPHMWPDEVAVNLVHGNDWRIIYLDAPHDFLSLSDAHVHPFQDFIETPYIFPSISSDLLGHKP